jgi:hypothetical protein
MKSEVMKHYEYEINLFVDGELSPGGKTELFNHLAYCEMCRNDLEEYYKVKNKARKFCDDKISSLMPHNSIDVFKESVPSKKSSILSANKEITSPKNNFYKYSFYTAAATVAVLSFLLVSIKPQIKQLTKNEVRVDTIFVRQEKSVIKFVYKKTEQPNSDATNINMMKRNKELYGFISNMRTDTLTSRDLIGKNKESKL